MNASEKLEKLKSAEKKASHLFQLIEKNRILQPGISEKETSSLIYDLAKYEFGVSKYWHKKIVRAGRNTILPYDADPEDILIQEDDIVWIDLGPVFETMEADFGRTYVLGMNPEKLRIRSCVESAWNRCRDYYFSKDSLTGKELFNFAKKLASEDGYLFGSEIAGHLIDEFPHKKNHSTSKINYICDENSFDLKERFEGKERFWILEIHFVDKEKKFGSFFEQLLIESESI
ncbi:aminopeptidase [Leptospira yasudae]|uniref:Aminopeptidase n=1 Tax=Leptospira yasudae TaxID=2202201 RepID=A0ABX9M111_9LEPT|nr:M24 family metallopeptidase [Leptospira yasudae]RHX78712.1 aminopeptidase [Leptospira yasudae]RHX91360.1 aminopeptidase [Leptospira yasudae]TGK27820.1 aminopeptidase P family protein [Leptospira yasudae]TGM06945.1 aminopeptidase P family protein [Leptospira yasudae]